MEKLRMEKLKEEKELMMMDVSMLSLLQQEYIRQCQMEILEKRRSCSQTIIIINALMLYMIKRALYVYWVTHFCFATI